MTAPAEQLGTLTVEVPHPFGAYHDVAPVKLSVRFPDLGFKQVDSTTSRPLRARSNLADAVAMADRRANPDNAGDCSQTPRAHFIGRRRVEARAS